MLKNITYLELVSYYMSKGKRCRVCVLIERWGLYRGGMIGVFSTTENYFNLEKYDFRVILVIIHEICSSLRALP